MSFSLRQNLGPHLASPARLPAWRIRPPLRLGKAKTPAAISPRASETGQTNENHDCNRGVRASPPVDISRERNAKVGQRERPLEGHPGTRASGDSALLRPRRVQPL